MRAHGVVVAFLGLACMCSAFLGAQRSAVTHNTDRIARLQRPRAIATTLTTATASAITKPSVLCASNFLIPMVADSDPDSSSLVDVYTRLGKDRQLFVSNYIDVPTSNLLISSLLYLHNLDPRTEIDIHMNCPGGDARAVLSVIDVIQHIDTPVRTVNMGLTSGMAVFLAAAGTAGLRSASRHARFLLQPQPEGNDTDLAFEQLSAFTRRSVDVLKSRSKAPFYLDAREAVHFGICDQVLFPNPATQLVRRLRDQRKVTFGHFAASKPLFHPRMLEKGN